MRPALPGAAIALIAFVLLLLCSLSTPIIESIYYLKVHIDRPGRLGSVGIRFGIWGWCTTGFFLDQDLLPIPRSIALELCSPNRLGFLLDPDGRFIVETILGRTLEVDQIFTAYKAACALVLASMGTAFLCLITGVLAVICNSRLWEILSFLSALLAIVVIWVSWIINIVIELLAKSRIQDRTSDLLTVSAGAALWLHLSAAIVLLLATCFTCFGMFGKYRDRRRSRRSEKDGRYQGR